MDVQLLIGSKEIPAHGGRTFDRINPVTGSVPLELPPHLLKTQGWLPPPPRLHFLPGQGLDPAPVARFLTKPPMQYRRKRLHSHLP